MRKKTMEGWKNATWKYGIRLQYNGYLGPIVTKDMAPMDKNNLILFNTEQEAEKELNKLKQMSNKIIAEFYKQEREDRIIFLRNLDKKPMGKFMNMCLLYSRDEEGNRRDDLFSLKVAQVINK
jgi:hypothetical protein